MFRLRRIIAAYNSYPHPSHCCTTLQRIEHRSAQRPNDSELCRGARQWLYSSRRGGGACVRVSIGAQPIITGARSGGELV